jgi:hypothetical protein
MKKLFLKTKTSNHACNSSTLDSIIETGGFIDMSLKVEHMKRRKQKTKHFGIDTGVIFTLLLLQKITCFFVNFNQ